MKLILFTLNDSTKRWMYDLATNSVYSWDDFAKLFVKNIFLMPRLLS